MSIDTGNCKSVVFSHELVNALLALARKVAIGELVAVKALMSITLGSVENDEG